MNFQKLIKLTTSFSIATALGACAAAPPKQVHTPDLPDAGPDGEYTVDFPKTAPREARYLKMTVSEDVRHKCVLEDAHFEFDEATPRPQDSVHMESLAGCLNHQRFDDYDILLVGHADARGAKTYNHTLAKERAMQVRKALVAHGVDAGRIQVKSRGDQAAVGGVSGDISHGFDRRVDIKLLGRVHAPEESGVAPTMMPGGS